MIDTTGRKGRQAGRQERARRGSDDTDVGERRRKRLVDRQAERAEGRGRGREERKKVSKAR